MPKTKSKPIINTQDAELMVMRDKDQAGRVCLFVRIGEDGMGYNRSASMTFRLTTREAIQLIEELQAVITDA